MQYWLMKSEPSAYSFAALVKDGKTAWNGVRNHQAANNLRAMKKGDRAFFYHSNEGLAVVGICEIIREFHPDPADQTGKFGMVDVKPIAELKRPVTMAEIKATPELKEMVLVKNSRLSVQPVTAAEWRTICKLGGVKG